MTNHFRINMKGSARLSFSLLFLLAVTPVAVHAQQPFFTDNADVTDRHKFHLQVSNEFDQLERALFPAKTQDVANSELDYGLLKNVEIGLMAPLLRINSAPIVIPDTATGIGDVSFHAKYNFLSERSGSPWPALALNIVVQIPTGNVKKQLGTGLTDYYLNGIVQKSLSKQVKARFNGGIVFAGNTVIGVLGIRSTRGQVFTAGASLVRQFTDKLDLGIELDGAVTGNFQLSKGQLQTLIGGNYAIRKNLTFDFGTVAG